MIQTQVSKLDPEGYGRGGMSHREWIASHQHFQLEMLRISDPERYQRIYPMVLISRRSVHIRDN